MLLKNRFASLYLLALSSCVAPLTAAGRNARDPVSAFHCQHDYCFRRKMIKRAFGFSKITTYSQDPGRSVVRSDIPPYLYTFYIERGPYYGSSTLSACETHGIYISK